MKKTGVVIGFLTLIAFSAGTMAVEEPESGRFSFQPRTPEPVDRFIPLTIRSLGKMPNDGDGNQVLGVNVYWRTKKKNQLQGRKIYTSLQPNLPRAGKDFINTNWSERVQNVPHIYEGNHENIEWLVWNGVDMDFDFDNGCPPTLGNTKTRFYYFRFKDYKIDTNGSGYCNDKTIISTPKDEDEDVAMTSFAFTHNSDICGRMGAYCVGAKGNSSNTLSRDIFIPSNQLEFLIIEVFGFEYNTNAQGYNQSFFTFPIQVVRFIPSEISNTVPGEDYMLVEMVGGKDGFEAFGNDDGKGYFSGSTIYGINSYSYKKSPGPDNYKNYYDFNRLSSLRLDIEYASGSRIPRYEDPKNTGVGLVMDLEYLDRACSEDKTKCEYPTR